MKYNSVLLIAFICLTYGCSTNSTILEGHGTIFSPTKSWEVQLLDESPGLSISTSTRTKPDGSTFSFTGITAEGWTNYPGAFAYVDNNDVVWAFNGESEVAIFEIAPPGGLKMWGLSTWTNSIPDEIKDRLPKK